MTSDQEHRMRSEAKRLGFDLRRTQAGHYVLTDKMGNGIVRATPGTLEEVKAFLESEAA